MQNFIKIKILETVIAFRVESDGFYGLRESMLNRAVQVVREERPDKTKNMKNGASKKSSSNYRRDDEDGAQLRVAVGRRRR